MSHKSFILTCLLFLLTVGCGISAKTEKQSQLNEDLKFWYRQPAGGWVEGLPFGNGHDGGMETPKQSR